MADSILHIRDLSVSHVGASDSAAILNGVSIDLAEGETLCLVGESGSGKTMTALSVMGLLPSAELAATGSIRVTGEEVIGASEDELRGLRATRMAMVFQEPLTALNPVMTIGAQIDEILAAHTNLGRGARRHRTYEMLEQVELADAGRIASSRPHQLSGGQRQRAMIAMALILKPKLLIADEPTSALDVRTQMQILGLLHRLCEEHGTAILFVTHDMGVVAEIADRVAVLRRGHIVESGPQKTVFEAPRNAYTQELLATVPTLVPRAPRPAGSRDVALSAHSLWKTYSDPSFFQRRKAHPALVKVDLQLEAGRTFGIVGESGSGKSTLARCLLRLIEPNEGDIRLGDVDFTALSRNALKPHRRDIQIVVQDPYRALNPRLPISDIIAEGPLNFGVPRVQALQNAADLLAMVGLSPKLTHARPHQLSGGQRQRVALARALALRPKVLVADEAVSALDMTTQAQILRLLADLQDRLGLAILFITHDLRVAAQICDEVAIMHEGQIVEQGKAADILTKPRHAYTQALIDAAPGRHWNFATSRPAATGAT